LDHPHRLLHMLHAGLYGPRRLPRETLFGDIYVVQSEMGGGIQNEMGGGIKCGMDGRVKWAQEYRVRWAEEYRVRWTEEYRARRTEGYGEGECLTVPIYRSKTT